MTGSDPFDGHIDGLIRHSARALLDSAIANLEKLLHCYSQQCDQVNFHKTWIELLAYQDVRDGVPRWKREMDLHHAEWRDLYAQHRVDAELLAGKKEATR